MPETPAIPARQIDDCWNRIGVRGDKSCPDLPQHVHCRNCPTHAAAAATLLDGKPPSGYAEEWTSHYAREKPQDETGTQSVVVFRIATEWLALPSSSFREVAILRTIHSLPHRRNGAVLGLVNVRGELLVCVSLANALGLDAGAPAEAAGARDARRRLLVVSHEGSRLVFPVDEVVGLHRYHPRDLKEVPATLARAAGGHTLAVLPWREHTLGCLDAGKLFHTLNRNLA